MDSNLLGTEYEALQNPELSSPPKVSESDLNLYSAYMKPSLWDNLLFWVIFSAVLFAVGIFGVSVGSVLYGVIFIIVGVALLSLFVYSYGNETEKYRHAMDDPQLPFYTADFSKSEIFRGDAFRMGMLYLYKHGSPIPVDYQNIDRIRIDVRKKILLTGFLKIYMKNDNTGVTLCELSGKDLRSGPENDMLGKMITKLQRHNPSIRFQQQELLFHETASVASESDEYSEIRSEKGSEQIAETPILLISNDGTVQKYRLSGRQIFGRPSQQENPELAVQNQSVSRRHGEFIVNSDSHMYRDLNSKNGTLLNGEKLVPMRLYDLHDGDMLRISSSVSLVYFDKDYTEKQDAEEGTAIYLKRDKVTHNTEESKLIRPCSIDGHVFVRIERAEYIVGDDGLVRDIRKTGLVCIHCGLWCDSVEEATKIGEIVEKDDVGDMDFPGFLLQ